MYGEGAYNRDRFLRLVKRLPERPDIVFWQNEKKLIWVVAWPHLADRRMYEIEIVLY